MRFNNVFVVIVTYEYPYHRLAELLETFSAQVRNVLLVDNNVRPDSQGIAQIQDRFANCKVIVNEANLGLAKALNLGLERALTERAEYALLLDQDSRPSPEMLSRLLNAARKLEKTQVEVAALGASVCDHRRSSALPFLRFTRAGLRKFFPTSADDEPIESDFLITSGCLVRVSSLHEIGMMDETLFIDNVDLEWCFRARATGFRLFGVPGAVLYHRLGDRVARIPLVGHEVILHGPPRQYFMTRNRLLLYRRAYVPLAWKLIDFPRMLFKLLYFSLFVKPRLENLKCMADGVKDGLRETSNFFYDESGSCHDS
ncbi:MAG: glycosyltransferase family 2 protein [Pseudomonadota bacterium]|nr:glycosyltransferase family 2 protein [Pseudomonadota bacterium]